MHVVGEEPDAALSALRWFSLLKTSKGTLSSPFWCLCQNLPLAIYTLIKLYYTKASGDQASSDSGSKSSHPEVMNPSIAHSSQMQSFNILQMFFYCIAGSRVSKMECSSVHVCMCVCVCVQLCPTLCNHKDCSPPGSSVHRILQARILERVATSLSRGSSWPRDRTHISSVSCSGRQVLYHSTTCIAGSRVSDARLGI